MSAAATPTGEFLAADRGEITRFVDALFRHADQGSWVHLRAFCDDRSEAWRPDKWSSVQLNGDGLRSVIDAAVKLAEAAANASDRVVFCPPVCTTRDSGKVAEKDIANGVTLSVDLDSADPAAAQRRLEGILGPVTVAVASGGERICPVTGEVQEKLHLHWRLRAPTRTFPEHVQLKEARRLAAELVGGDPSAAPPVHPLRWPGSWHRKSTPRLSRIVAIDLGAEIDLGDAVRLLREAAAAAGDTDAADPQDHRSGEPEAEIFDVVSALAAIPNAFDPKESWHCWNRIGMATWRATAGSALGFTAFAAWSAKSPLHSSPAVRERWNHYPSSPPSDIGAGTLFYEAAQARPGWRKPSATPRAAPHREEGAGLAAEQFAQWPELDPAALYGIAGDVVRTLDPHTESDPAAILVQTLVAAGNALGRCAYYLVEGDRHCPNLFSVLVGDSGKGRKGTSWGRVLSIMEVADPVWAKARNISGLSTGEGLIWHVRDPIMGFEKQGKGISAERVQIEIDPGISDKRLLVTEAEFSRTIAVMGRDGNTLSAVMRDAWDRSALSSLTKNSPGRATGAHISIVGHITAEELRAVLDRTAMANGFANRILWIMARRSKQLPLGGNLEPEAIEDLGRRLGAFVGAAQNASRVALGPEAEELWRGAYAALSTGRPGLLGAITNRAEAQVIRLALIYALLDGRGVISAAHLKAGLAVWEYAEASCEFIWRGAVGNPVADEIMRVLRIAGAVGKTRTELRDLFGRNRRADEIGSALSLLAAEGRAASCLRSPEGGGRPAEVWTATPGVI